MIPLTSELIASEIDIDLSSIRAGQATRSHVMIKSPRVAVGGINIVEYSTKAHMTKRRR